MATRGKFPLVRLRLGPRAGLAFVILLGLSTAFPIAASLVSPSGISAVVGVVDILLAAVLVLWVLPSVVAMVNASRHSA